MLDATDNVATRYLLNDACVLADKPLVSGSALRFEGQVRDKVNISVVFSALDSRISVHFDKAVI